MANSERPHYLGHRQRLRERFIKNGVAGLADYEVVELMLTLAIPQGDVKPTAKALIERFDNLRGILDAPLEDLKQVKGIGDVAATAVRVIREVAALYLQQSAEQQDSLTNRLLPPSNAYASSQQSAEQQDSLTNPEALSRFWRMRIGSLSNEVFHVGYPDSGYRLLRDGVETLEEGTVDRAAVYPRRVIEAALRRGAAALVFAHNHPNGDVAPSEQDKTLTRALALAAATVQIKVLDHLIVSPDKVFSFREAGLL